MAAKVAAPLKSTQLKGFVSICDANLGFGGREVEDLLAHHSAYRENRRRGPACYCVFSGAASTRDIKKSTAAAALTSCAT